MLMGTFSRLRVFFVVAMVVAGWMGGSQAAAAQGEEEGFSLMAFTAYCPPGYAGPFVDCTPWDGVTVVFQDLDVDFSTSCTTLAGDRAASCTVTVPFGSSIIAAIDETAIPGGYVLQQNSSQLIEIPDGPPEGEFGGPMFVLFEQVNGEQPDAFPFPVAASICEDAVAPGDDCVPWEGVVIDVTSADGTFADSCVAATFIEWAAGCEVGVPFGSTVTASISDDQIPDGYELYTFDPTWDIPLGVPGGIMGQPVFWLVPMQEADLTPLPVYASICSDALPPNDDCLPWEGVEIVAVTNDAAAFANACVTETFFETVAGCEILMPRGANVTASISDDQVPEGYQLFVEVPMWDMPEEGELESGPYFFLVADDGETPAPTPTPTTPVTALPSTGSGTDPNGLATYLALAGVSALLMAGAGYASTLRKR
jgi:hypothetical protein